MAATESRGFVVVHQDLTLVVDWEEKLIRCVAELHVVLLPSFFEDREFSDQSNSRIAIHFRGIKARMDSLCLVLVDNRETHFEMRSDFGEYRCPMNGARRSQTELHVVSPMDMVPNETKEEKEAEEKEREEQREKPTEKKRDDKDKDKDKDKEKEKEREEKRMGLPETEREKEEEKEKGNVEQSFGYDSVRDMKNFGHLFNLGQRSNHFGELVIEIPETHDDEFLRKDDVPIGKPVIVTVMTEQSFAGNQCPGLHLFEKEGTLLSYAPWFPCIDSNYRYSFKLNITTPHKLRVLCSGEEESAVESADGLTFEYRISGVRACDVGFVIGQLEELPYKDEVSLRMLYPEEERKLTAEFTWQSIHQTLITYEDCIQMRYPFNEMVLVFAGKGFDHFTLGNLVVLPRDALFDDTQIDECDAGMMRLAVALAESWIRHEVHYRYAQDLWIVEGLIQVLAWRHVEYAKGKSEIEYVRSQWRLHRDSNGPHFDTPPLASDAWREGRGGLFGEPFVFKAWMVMGMLERMIGSTAFDRHLLRGLLHRNLGKAVETPSLEKVLQTVFSQTEVSRFFDRWVYGDEKPHIYIEYEWMPQQNPKHKLTCRNLSCEDTAGTVKVRLIEVESETTEHIKVPKLDSHTELQSVCQSRRRSRGEPRAAAPARNDTPSMGILVDPDYEWLAQFTLSMEPKLGITQLLHMTREGQKDVKAQLEAIHGLRLAPTEDTSAALLRVLNDHKSNALQVRIASAKALAEDKCPITALNNRKELVAFLRKMWTQHLKNGSVRFDDLENYFLLKRVVRFVSEIRDDNNFTPLDVADICRDVLLEVMDANGQRVCIRELQGTLIECLGNIRLPRMYVDRLSALIRILGELLHMEEIFPSGNGRMQRAVLRAFAHLKVNNPGADTGWDKVPYAFFMECSEFNPWVNLVAFECAVWLSLTQPNPQPILRALCQTLDTHSRLLRLQMVESWTKIIHWARHRAQYEDEEERKQAQKTFGDEKIINMCPAMPGADCAAFLEMLDDPSSLGLRPFCDDLYQKLVQAVTQGDDHMVLVFRELYISLWGHETPCFMDSAYAMHHLEELSIGFS